METTGLLLTRGETARILGLKEGTLAVWASRGDYRLPFVRLGRAVRYRRCDVEEFIERNRFASDEVEGGEK